MEETQVGDELSLRDVISTPVRVSRVDIHVGMEFESVTAAEETYANYARGKGFGICRRNSREKVVQFFCHREGLPRKRGRSISSEGLVTEDQIRASKFNKVGCRACLYIALLPNSGTWRVSKFEDTHNHDMVSPTSLKFLRTHKKVPGSAKNLTSIFENTGLPVGRVPDVLYSNPEEAEFTQRDCYNYIRQIRKSILDVGDAQSVYNWCSIQQEHSPEFRYAIQLDEESRMCNFFWIDARSRKAYEIFGDCVSFDTTYKTNKYSMSFAPFVGIDNHRHSILFGCALLQDETEETFIWLFESWLHAVNGKQPTGFITDQDLAIMNAAAKVFPSSRHRLCVWHMNKKIPERLAHIYHEKSKFKGALNSCMYGSRSIAHFEGSWETLVQEYNLHENQWFSNLFQMRKLWVPVFSKYVFLGGMNTTGCSESINVFFDGFVHSGTTLNEFVMKYGQTLDKRYDNFRRSEFESKHKVPTVQHGLGFEQHAASIYTFEIFKLFQLELRKILAYSRDLEFQVDSLRTYKITNMLDKLDVSFVQLELSNMDIKCECKLFESMGILCGHICSLLFEYNVHKLPDKYVLPRWTKDIGRVLWEHPIARSVEVSRVRSFEYRSYFDELSIMGDNSNLVHEYILKGLKSLTMASKTKYEFTEMNVDVGSSSTPRSESALAIQVCDPSITITKGRKKTSRIRSSVEIATDPRVKCLICNKYGHNRRTCQDFRINDV